MREESSQKNMLARNKKRRRLEQRLTVPLGQKERTCHTGAGGKEKGGGNEETCEGGRRLRTFFRDRFRGSTKNLASRLKNIKRRILVKGEGEGRALLRGWKKKRFRRNRESLYGWGSATWRTSWEKGKVRGGKKGN